MGRVTATVLFTDLVGSTELRARLGEEAADDLRRRHDQLLAQAVETRNGRVVKGLGDGIMATFAGASDAVAAAVAIQQAVDRLNRSGTVPVPLAVRVGLSAGDVAFEDDDVHGTPVIEASRLCGAAEGGEIVIADVVRVLAGAADEDVADRGRLELKGLHKPVAAWAVRWEPAAVSAMPMPALLTNVGRIFVGRDAQLDRLEQLWKEAAAGERRVALLAGEPGIGKTRLAAELARVVGMHGAVVLAGRCDEDMGVPYQPFVEALRHYLAHAGELRLGRYGGELTRLVPELARLVPALPEPLRSDPETERYRLFDALTGWLADVSAETPVFLLLDDLHWAAKPTLLLLRHVLRSPETLRLLVVVTYRDTDVGRGHPLSDLLTDLRRSAGMERLSLGGLDRAAVAAFIEAAAGHAMSGDEEADALVGAVWDETDGSPFFVAEVLRHLTESGAVVQRDGRWITVVPVEDLGIPEGVRDVVGRRLSRLSEEANRALAVAAVVGVEFDPAVVHAAMDLSEDALLDALEEAVTARLVSEVSAPEPRYRFGHAVVRATLYDELTAARRVALHRKVARAIETVHAGALDDHLSALAHHWARASAPAADAARAVDYASRAGDRALQQLAHDEAVAYYRQAIELLDVADGPPDTARRGELFIALGEAQRRAGDPAYRDTLLEAARLAQERGDGDALARAVLANSRGMLPSSVLNVDHDRVAVLEAALRAGSAADTPERARLLANLGLELTASGERDRRLGLSDQALAMAKRLGDDATLAHVLTARFYTFTSPSTLATRLADTTQLIEVAQRLGDPTVIVLAHFVRARVETEHGDIEDARADLAVAERMATELGQPTLRWYTTFARAGHLLLSGRLLEGEIAAMEAGRLAESTRQPDGSLYLATQLIGIRSEQDRLEEVEAVWADAVQQAPDAILPRVNLARVLADLDRIVEAEALLQGLAIDDFSLIPVNNLWLWVMTALALVASRAGDEAVSATVHQRIAPYADQIAGVTPLWVGSVSHYLGLAATTLSHFSEAEARFAAAEATHERIGAPTWLARTRLEWARMLLTRRKPGDAERARELLGQALTSARELGLANVERRAVELLS
jgi:class 3 adenylate cyclase/tetratricopeptide (TPR) repeat protein